MKSKRSLAPVSTHKPVLQALCFFSSPRPIRKKHTDRVFLQALFESLDQACQPLDQALSLPIYSPPLSDMFDSSFHRPNTNHSDSLHTSDGALICFALMSHRRAVCRGNLVFCCTHKNLSVHRPNTNHLDSLHTS